MTNAMTNNITESRMIELIQEEILNKISEIQLTSLLGSNEVTKLSLLNEAFPGGVVAQKNGPPVGKWSIRNIKYITEKTISDLDNPKKWELESLMGMFIGMAFWFNPIDIDKRTWKKLGHTLRPMLEPKLSKTKLSNGQTAWEIVGPIRTGATMDAGKRIANKVKDVGYSIVTAKHAAALKWYNDGFWDTIDEFNEEYIEWREFKGAWLTALEYVAVGTMGLAALFGGPVLIAGATVSAFFIAAIETPYVAEAFRRGKYGLAALRAIYAYAGLLVKGFRALKVLTKGAPPAVVAVVESAQLTLKQNLLNVSKELAATGILMGAVYALFSYSPQFKKAYDTTVLAYSTSICRGKTGTFDQVKGRNESPECVDPEVSQYYDRPGVQRKVLMWDIENDEDAVAELEKVKKEIKSVADEIDEPLGTTNENVFYENRFSKLAGI
jgi:hypothetical protein